MAKTPWMMTAIPLALILGLAGCNGGDEESAPAAEENGQSSQASAESTGSAERTPRDETSTGVDGGATDTTAGNESTDGGQDQAGANGSADTTGNNDTEQGGGSAASDTALGESAGEEAANDSWDNPKDDIDQALKETERRFKEAEKEINDQFEQAQKQDVKEQQTIELDDSSDGSSNDSN